jgi:hypothetical protein
MLHACATPNDAAAMLFMLSRADYLSVIADGESGGMHERTPFVRCGFASACGSVSGRQSPATDGKKLDRAAQNRELHTSAANVCAPHI